MRVAGVMTSRRARRRRRREYLQELAHIDLAVLVDVDLGEDFVQVRLVHAVAALALPKHVHVHVHVHVRTGT